MLDFTLNVGGSEWMIIIFVALIVLFGTNKFPEVAKKMGKVVGEYNKAKNEVQKQMNDYTKSEDVTTNFSINKPVKNEREKLEIMAKSLGIKYENKTISELRQIISSQMGNNNNNSDDKIKDDRFKNLFLVKGKHFFPIFFLQNYNILSQFQIHNILFLTFC